MDEFRRTMPDSISIIRQQYAGRSGHPFHVERRQISLRLAARLGAGQQNGSRQWLPLLMAMTQNQALRR
jgi:hypothetical protein